MDLDILNAKIESCVLCPRLVEWRERVAIEKRASYANEEYWGRPVTGFGDPAAQIAVVGLAPAAHGANRTGRMFTGDRSGDWLYRGMYRAGLANQPEAIAIDDGLELENAWVTSAVKCVPPANKPTAVEQNTCRSFLTDELAALSNLRVIIALGGIGASAVARHFDIRPRPKFGHGVEVQIDDRLTLLCSYHVSQQNTFTGRLTEPMLDEIFERALRLASAPIA
ncbi:MAG: uracil-DNA glycosylase family 4 [Verrucomicrobiales bacterium]|jgi:uracil-DNA glycosylase family 4